MEHVIHLGAAHPLRLLILLWHTEASLDHRLQVICLEEGQIALLQASHLVIGEPIRYLLIPQLIHYLRIELVVIDVLLQKKCTPF